MHAPHLVEHVVAGRLDKYLSAKSLPFVIAETGVHYTNYMFRIPHNHDVDDDFMASLGL